MFGMVLYRLYSLQYSIIAGHQTIQFVVGMYGGMYGQWVQK